MTGTVSDSILLGMAEVTTIKVPRALRERISRDASRRGVTAAVLIGELLDSYEREERLAAVGRAYAGPPDTGYVAETVAWDEVAADGMTE